MKKSDVKKWVKALRSGEYKQARRDLCKEDDSGECSYCCLGVACDIFVEGDWIQRKGWIEWSIDPYEEFALPSYSDREGWGFTDTTSFPSLKMLRKMGLGVGYAQRLADLNDKGLSFMEIADKIEKDLL